MDNLNFLKVLKTSFLTFLETGSRSNEKLKILHGAIATDLQLRLGEDYIVHSLGTQNEKEVTIDGRYIKKRVDISIKKNNEVVGGIAVKFVMQNYAQNSNNYFENMLGETANIRCNKIPYFQIFIIFEKLPYYDNNGNIKKWEIFTEHNIKKYKLLSKDNIEIFAHTPTKTLLYVIKLPKVSSVLNNKNDYNNYYLHNTTDITISNFYNTDFRDNSNIIYNDYDSFIEKVKHYILSL